MNSVANQYKINDEGLIGNDETLYDEDVDNSLNLLNDTENQTSSPIYPNSYQMFPLPSFTEESLTNEEVLKLFEELEQDQLANPNIYRP